MIEVPRKPRLLVRVAAILLLISIFFAAAVALVVLADRVLLQQNGSSKEILGQVVARHNSIYPYSGAHTLAHQHHVGPMPWENQTFYKDFDVQTGDHGFFVDFDLENPPPKAVNEFRIILTGGSGAQGWGGRTNREMFYYLLEKKLNERISPATGLRYRVINLAMAGSISFQNYVALNIWGQRLNPDLIISWSGGNDLFVPIITGSDAYLHYYGVAAPFVKAPIEEQSAIISWLDTNLPGIAAFTNIKAAIRLFGFTPGITQTRRMYLAKEKYITERGYSNKDAVLDVALPNYIHSLQSIKRDFRGIPMIVMFQSIDWRQAYPFLEREYAQFTNATEQSLQAYVNHDWYFMNMHDIWNKNHLFKEAELFYGLHLPSHLQDKVADLAIARVPQRFWRKAQ